jgi:hypothetical protein
MSEVVTADRMRSALGLVEATCEEWVDLGLFPHGVLVRFRQWKSGLPERREDLAVDIARMAAQTQKGSGALINGVALDEQSRPSVESLVLFYARQEPLLFPPELVLVTKAKLKAHSGPRYMGPWP